MENEPRFAATEFVVAASHNEMFALWKEFHEKVEWEEDSRGFSQVIGEFGGMPINLCFFWAKINGHLVMFWEQVSMVTHLEMAERWLKERCSPRWDDGRRLAWTDAMNFHHVLEHCQADVAALRKEGGG